MTRLLEIKEKIIHFIEEYDWYVNILLKFAIAFALFAVINNKLGYNTNLTGIPVMLVMSLVGSLLPFGATLVMAAALMLAHIYVLSIEAAIVALLLVLILYMIYFRFSPREGKAAALMPVCLAIGIPYVMPVGCGLLRRGYSVVSIVCSTVLYYFVVGIKLNETTLGAVAAEESDTQLSTKFSVAIAQLTNNREMFLSVGVFLAVTLVVYLVRRLNVEYAWTIAIVLGILIEFGAFFAGYMIMNISGKFVSLTVGCLVSLMICFVIQFFCMNLDYARTERVQFEDDEYYYYVKAVPKKQVAAKERTVKHFGNTGKMGRRIEHDRKPQQSGEDEESIIAQELELDDEL